MIKLQSGKTFEIRNLFIELVESDEVAEGDRLPSEAALATRFGVSRNAIREILVQMETEGLILRNHGIGTFLRRTPKRHGTYQSFRQLIVEGGRKPSVNLVGLSDCVPTQSIVDELSATRKNAIKKIERVLKADPKPMAYIVDRLPARIIEQVPSWGDFAGDMVTLIGQAVGRTRFTQNVSVNAVSCDAALSEKLGVEVGEPVIHVHTLMQTVTLEPVAVTDSFLRPCELPMEYLGTIRVAPNW